MPTVPPHLQQYVDYINNASGGQGSVKRTYFEEDWEPVGEHLIIQLYEHKLVFTHDGMLNLIPELCGVAP